MTAFASFLRENWLFLLLVGALAAGYALLRQGPSSVASAEEFDAVRAKGGPVLVEFYSDT